MPTLRHVQSGAVVNVSDATAARLGSEWGPLEEKKAQAKPATKRAQARKSDDES